MRKLRTRILGFLALMLFSVMSSCAPYSEELEALPPSETIPTLERTPSVSADKWSLWNGTHLRGANIYQRRVYPDLDGPEFMGRGPFGPPYVQEDFSRLSALGANYVNISHPGLFTETPPYVLDEDAQANLDRLLAMAARADLFAVITFRTGPGRSEFAIIGVGGWAPESLLLETVWEDPEAQAAWAEMWRYTAERYREDPIVVGYDLMCEPNSNASLDIWDPGEFEAEYGSSLRDWNLLYPRITEAIRTVDEETPILVGGNSYSAIEWLPYIQPPSDPRTVLTFHQYSPHVYTHQEPVQDGSLPLTYPGRFDLDYDGIKEDFNSSWLNNLLMNRSVYLRAQDHSPLAVNEFGLMRWEPGGAEFLSDELYLFEYWGWNYAIWMWYPTWEPLAEGDNDFNFRLGPDPEDRTEVSNDLLSIITEYWAYNTIRPSTFNP